MASNNTTTNLPIRTLKSQQQEQPAGAGVIDPDETASSTDDTTNNTASAPSPSNPDHATVNDREDRFLDATLEINTILSDFQRQLHLCHARYAEAELQDLLVRLVWARQGMQMLASRAEARASWMRSMPSGGRGAGASTAGAEGRGAEEGNQRLGLTLE
ncbi:hypothetical protein K431DRAFT_281727 [Polychaeton citri CBS 116435]|uniref:Uncharacterized protein n=1 Tax=Polychaeton citri CBS 116435 TaxID=1314669 RepID=A0A9P4QEI9_9PEZI|nr:hypothetical protein K431DRAFT_281727 [Polychaeton citri CBS 116435]